MIWSRGHTVKRQETDMDSWTYLSSLLLCWLGATCKCNRLKIDWISLSMLLISRYLFAPKADNFYILLTKVSPCAQLLPRNSKITKNNNIQASFNDFWPEIVLGKVPVRISSINHGTLWGNIFIVWYTYQVPNENICCACRKTFLLLHCKFSSLHCAKFETN